MDDTTLSIGVQEHTFWTSAFKSSFEVDAVVLAATIVAVAFVDFSTVVHVFAQLVSVLA